MDEILERRIAKAVLEWAAKSHGDDAIVIGLVAQDGSEKLGEDDTVPDETGVERYLVDYAVRVVGRWLVAEVWVRDQQILGLNDLGEGLPLENDAWPWPDDETP
jgi:hypothetical protein